MTKRVNDLDTAFAFFNEVGIVDQLASHAFERRLPDGLTLAQFSVLNNFVRLGGTRTPAQLAEAFQVTRGAMTNTLARLEQRGCVRMERSAADGRSKIVSITAAGKRLRERGLKQASRDLEYVLDHVTASELQPALRLLRRVRELLDDYRS